MARTLCHLLVALAAIAALPSPATAQDMTTSDVTRLEQSLDQLEADLVKLRQQDRVAARDLETDLADLEDEVTYLKVRLRREGRVPRADYVDVRDRIEDLRNRVSGNGTSGRYGRGTVDRSTTDAVRTSSTSPGTIPSGTELDLRLDTALDSETAQVEDRFEATTAVDVQDEDGPVLIPAGSRVRGVVTAVQKAGRLERKGRLDLSFDQVIINGRSYPIRGTIVEALESGGYREDAEKIGAGAAVGGIIGGILGGVKGAITGILIGGGGVVAATEGEDVELRPGTILRMRLDQPLAVRQ